MTQQAVGMNNKKGLTVYTRGGGKELEQPYEKPVVMPAADNKDPTTHAWTDARFATDIMAEHALFFCVTNAAGSCGRGAC